ncbi:MAG: BREX system ATP-binding domain-containing protein [Brevefilum sp.]
MAKLAIRLLGSFKVELDGQLITNFRSDKVRALLAFLAVESQRPWMRDHLADLLWPDYPENKAQANLRNALSNIRRLIGDVQVDSPFILTRHSTIQINPGVDYWVDVHAFQKLSIARMPHYTPKASNMDISDLESVLALYQGDFMAGFSINSPAFETWLVKTREYLRQERVKIIRNLTRNYIQLNKLELALAYVKLWIEQEPWEEEAYRYSMKILLALGRRNAALAQFEDCQRRLADDLGVEPEPETIQLYKNLKHGLVVPPPLSTSQPRIIQKSTPSELLPVPEWLSERAHTYFESGLFVGRQNELTQLDTWLAEALQGYGKPAFIMGEPGSGKTYLIKEFANRALQREPNLLVLWGQCNAFTGQGDPYYPFMNMTRTLAGDVEPLLSTMVISPTHLQRIWQILPHSLASLAQKGPDLIKQFLTIYNPLTLSGTHPGVTHDLIETIQALINKTVTGRLSQPVLNDQFTEVLSALSIDHPLILVFDDLQWIDPGSTSLLFHLGRQIAGKRVFLVGAFRPIEVFAGLKDQTHPIEAILNELQTGYGDIVINLDESEGQEFVAALLDSEPNAFSQDFYDKLYQQSSGHPLFTIELLRGMQLRQEIRKNPDGQWIEGLNLNWDELPARIEAVIARRISMMPVECQELMTLACVQGDVFSVEVLAQVTGKPEKMVFDLLSQQVCKRHRLITPQGITPIGDRRLTHYRFRHLLFQIYLYNHLDIVEKTRLHGLVGNELEKLYKDHSAQFPELAHTLARHFELAQDTGKALHYYTQAGKNAQNLSAHQAAVLHFSRALNLLNSLPPSTQRDQAELDLQLSLGPPLTALKGWGAPELEAAYDRTQTLIEKSDDSTKLIPVLWLLATFRLGRSEHAEVDRLVTRLYKLAQQANDPALLALAYLQVSPVYQGKLRQARILLERAAALQDINQGRFLAQRFGFAPAAIALTYLSNCLWLLGYPDQAAQVNEQAFKMAGAIGHPMTTCYVTSRSCWIGILKGDLDQVHTHAEQLYQVATKYSLKNFEYAAVFFTNWVKFMNHEDRNQAVEVMNEVIDAYYATKTVLNRTAFLVLFSQVCLVANERERGLQRVNESIKLGDDTGERWFQAEAYRTRGELLLMGNQGDQTDEKDYLEAQTCFETALQIARDQGAKAFELRAAISLARLWQSLDRTENAYHLLTDVYGWFTEGFQTADNQAAQALIESLRN